MIANALPSPPHWRRGASPSLPTLDHAAHLPHRFLTTFSRVVLRGGPRLLVYLAAALFVAALIALIHLHGPWRSLASSSIFSLSFTRPSSEAPSPSVAYYGDIWAQPDRLSSADLAAGVEVLEDDSGAVTGAVTGLGSSASTSERGLRIVVFGERDVAMPSSHETQTGSAKPSHGLTSNALYARAIQNVLNVSRHSSGPGMDYSFLPELFPVRWEVPDLQGQVSAFLAIPHLCHPLLETLWIISVGTWDIWALAPLPLDVSYMVVDAMLEHLFSQADRLYYNVLVHKSVAASCPVAAPVPVEGVAKALPHQNFRILIPKLYDPSMTPGWKEQRPVLPSVHSSAEQLRNAAKLTARWNDLLSAKLQAWVKDSKSSCERDQVIMADLFAEKAKEKANKATKADAAAAAAAAAAVPAAPDTLSSSLTPDEMRVSSTSRNSSTTPANEGHISLPLRDAIFFDLSGLLLDIMYRRQFSGSDFDFNAPDKVVESELHDNGKHARRRRQIHPARAAPPPSAAPPSRLPESASSPPQPAASSAAVAVSFQHMWTPCLTTVEADAAGLQGQPLSSSSHGSGKMAYKCDDPDEHLFYSPFTLSQRAIDQLAQKAAEMVRSDETVRRKLDKGEQPANISS